MKGYCPKCHQVIDETEFMLNEGICSSCFNDVQKLTQSIKEVREMGVLSINKLDVDNESICNEFLKFLEGYTPIPWDDKYPMAPTEWVFDRYSKRDGYCDLPNVLIGYATTIDNCSGEFWNFHFALGRFLQEKIREVGFNIRIKLIEQKWMENSDMVFDEIAHILKYKICFKNTQDFLEIPRLESSEARNSWDNLTSFLIEYFQLILERFCSSA